MIVFCKNGTELQRQVKEVNTSTRMGNRMKLIDGFYDWIKEGDDNSPEQYNLDYKNSESCNSKIPVLI